MKKKTRKIQVRDLLIGGDAPISVQSMCATRTRDIDQTNLQVQLLSEAGADIIRIAVDNKEDVESLAEIRKSSSARLSVDLQENFRLASLVAPFVNKIRYNPGHLHHLEKDRSIEEKVQWIAQIAKDHGCALRVGVNCGSIAPEFLERYPNDHISAIVESALWHCDLLDKAGFDQYLVSLKDSSPQKVITCNERFSQLRPDIPLHLGVTEAGMPPEGIIKTRIAFEKLIPQGIGDTIRVSLTVPFDRKDEEIKIGRQILEDIKNHRFISVPDDFDKGLNIISCPSCSRVENTAFIELAEKVKDVTSYAKDQNLVIAVMGCRVNGPGETDDADLGLWCGPKSVTLKHKSKLIGQFTYDTILPRLRKELDNLTNTKS